MRTLSFFNALLLLLKCNVIFFKLVSCLLKSCQKVLYKMFGVMCNHPIVVHPDIMLEAKFCKRSDSHATVQTLKPREKRFCHI